MNAGEIMTADPACLGPSDTVGRALDLLRELSVRHLPVVDNGRLVGMISDRDLRDVSLSVFEAFDDPETAQARKQQRVADLMESDPIHVGPEDGLTDVIDLLIEHRIGALPVVDTVGDVLLGIVSYIDVLQAVREEA